MDLANPGKDGLSLVELDAFLQESREMPNWRMRADVECGYYDSNQHSAQDIALAQERGLPVVTVNLVAPTINLVLGMEAQTRGDWVVKPDGSQGGLTSLQADGLSMLVNDVERNAHADDACAEAYASQIKAGIGWIETSKNSNPFEYPYRVGFVDRREVWWDMRAKDKLLKDCRWLMRRKWNDVDVLQAKLDPKYHPLIQAAMAAGEAGWDYSRYASAFPYLQDDLISRDWWGDSAEWRSSDRKRACAYEVWYRKWQRGWVLKFADGRVVEYDRRNPIHQAGVVMGGAEPILASYHKMRCSWWLGPFRLFDFASPYSHNDYPYTPFWGYIEDGTNTPYGMIRAMKSLQDEVNARRAKMMWQLSATRAIVEEDAVADHNATAQEIGRADAYIVLKKNRRPRQGDPIKIDEHTGMSSQQFQVYEDAKRSLQQAGGVYSAMLGDGSSGAEAGVAIDQLIQQGTTALAKINSNYKMARAEVGRKVLALRLDDLDGKEVRVDLGETARSSTRTVTFNKRATDQQTGISFLQNDTTKMLWKMAISDVPNSPTHNQQRLQQLVEYAKSLPPELQVVFADIIVMASDLPNKDVIASRIRQITGQTPAVDPESATPEELMEIERAQQQQQRQQGMEDAAMALEADQMTAETENIRADTASKRADTIAVVTALKLAPLTPDPGEVQAAELEGEQPPGEGGAPAPPQGPTAGPEDIAAASQDAHSLEQHQHEGSVSLGAEMGA